MNTEQLKDLHFALMCWQGDYDSVHDKEQYDMFGSAANAINQLEAAQKRIAELEANARIGQQARDGLLARAIEAEEELARRDALEPVSLKIDLSGISEEAIKKVISSARQDSSVICEPAAAVALPNELDNESGFVELYRNGYNKAISDARALGCKPEPVVVLPSERTSDGVAYGVSGTFTMGKSFGFNEGLALSREALEAAGIKWRAAE